MNTIMRPIIPKAFQDLLNELEASSQSRVARFKRSAETSFSSFRGWKRRDFVTGPEDLGAEGESWNLL